MAFREKEQADFDLERFIGMFDEAMTSNDPRVKNALRQLMMMVILTDTGNQEAGMSLTRNSGPLRQMYDDVRHLNSRLSQLDDMVRRLQNLGKQEQVSMPVTGGYSSFGETKALNTAQTSQAQQYDPHYKTRIHGHK
jgi:hypothetical protein